MAMPSVVPSPEESDQTTFAGADATRSKASVADQSLRVKGRSGRPFFSRDGQ